MWAGIRFINGYSPIRPAGVAREFDFAIHGEIPSDMGTKLLEKEAGPDGLLTRLGVDGIVVANEMAFVPEPATEWHVVAATSEGRVFHRWEALPRLRSLASIDSRPNEQFAEADITQIVDCRNELQADIRVPPDGRASLLTVARPFFPGYRAKLGDVELKVNSYRGLIPTIEIPAGVNGRLTLSYRPWWLAWGGGVSVLSAAFFLGSLLTALKKN
jgi:hypothetical protein